MKVTNIVPDRLHLHDGASEEEDGQSVQTNTAADLILTLRSKDNSPKIAVVVDGITVKSGEAISSEKKTIVVENKVLNLSAIPNSIRLEVSNQMLSPLVHSPRTKGKRQSLAGN